MHDPITAVYEKGILRPLQPLDLREHQAVRIQILPQQAAQDEAEAAIRILIQAGLVTPPQRHTDAHMISETERSEVADRLGRASGKPLSEMIIEDRGDR